MQAGQLRVQSRDREPMPACSPALSFPSHSPLSLSSSPLLPNTTADPGRAGEVPGRAGAAPVELA
eukprot:4112162-Pleurochrysis_carterae.AAC.2